MSYEKVKQAKHLSIGLKQTLKAIEQNLAQEIIIAKDADKRLTSKVIQFGAEKNLIVTYVDSMKQLGKASGIEVGAAAVAILKD
ncbi:50S ribosomal protein L7ae-like protein [Tepidibacillus infernus]|uniref:Ribosomal protein L7Ae-like protein n=1 Tax=Tepidibacillus decaturensis TaxID=1413211 RepID=A0A135L7C8_9BACI|nr:MULTISPECIES: 50S ribosomal protein L7ae-like protein [Tepidibacillus]KXG44894.1 ribosomal protein L7Ae-like protein [Tepidibacillus decaturensis]GBF12030.1 ribosome-associated protein L7Ae-like protein [Tepidibacillus sp. HK-1]